MSDRDIVVVGAPAPAGAARIRDLAFRPERAFVSVDLGAPRPIDWTIEALEPLVLVNERLLEDMYPDRRKCGRKIRQQRRRLRRTNAAFGHAPGAGVPEWLLRAKVALR